MMLMTYTIYRILSLHSYILTNLLPSILTRMLGSKYKKIIKPMNVYFPCRHFLQNTCITGMLLFTLNTLFDESRIGSFFRNQLKWGLNIFHTHIYKKLKYNVIPTKKPLIYV